MTDVAPRQPQHSGSALRSCCPHGHSPGMDQCSNRAATRLSRPYAMTDNYRTP